MGISAGVAALIAGAMSAGGGVIGGALGGRNQGSNAPIRDPEFAGLQSRLLQQALGNLRNPRQVARGIEEGGITRINDTFGLGEQALQAKLTSRGFGGSGVEANAISGLERGRLGEVGRFRSTIPLLQQQLQQQDFMNALQLLQGEQVGNVFSTSTGGGVGRGIGQGLGQGGGLLGFLTSQGAFPQNKNTSGSGVGNDPGNLPLVLPPGSATLPR